MNFLKSVSSVIPEDGTLSGLCDPVVFLVARNDLGKPKISDFHQRLAGHQDVSGREVSVHKAQGLQVLHPLEKQKHSSSSVEQGEDGIQAHMLKTDLTDLGSKEQHPPCVDLMSVVFQVANEAAIRQVLHHQTHTESTCKQFASL